MSKGNTDAPAADPNIGLAQKEMSALAKEQWNTFKTDIYPELKRATAAQETRLQGAYEQDQTISKEQQARAKENYDLYKTEGLPQLQKMRAEAEQYNEPAYQEEMALKAGADVATASENQRLQMEMRNQRYGIDPTSGVAQGQSNANAVMTAAAQAQAQNQTRQAAHEIGLQKLSNVYNAYAGFPAQGNAATGLALNASGQGTAAGQASVGNATNTASTYNAGVGSNSSGWNSIGTLGVQKYQADVGAFKAQQEAESAGMNALGQAVGTGAALYLKSDIRVKQNITQVGRLDNGLPLYSFEYKPQFQAGFGNGFRIGVMAQDVEKVIPDAVSIDADGYKMVDYGKVLNHGI
jgi:hypothetical protein